MSAVELILGNPADKERMVSVIWNYSAHSNQRYVIVGDKSPDGDNMFGVNGTISDCGSVLVLCAINPSNHEGLVHIYRYNFNQYVREQTLKIPGTMLPTVALSRNKTLLAVGSPWSNWELTNNEVTLYAIINGSYEYNTRLSLRNEPAVSQVGVLIHEYLDLDKDDLYQEIYKSDLFGVDNYYALNIENLLK